MRSDMAAIKKEQQIQTKLKEAETKAKENEEERDVKR